MLRVEKYIEEAILYNYCVVIPSFGALISNKIDAQINEQTGVITPPSRELIFNSRISHDDGLLCMLISKKENLSYNEVRSLLAKQVNEWRTELDAGRLVTIEKVGEFNKFNVGKGYEFKSFTENSMSADMYGLGSLCVDPLETNIATYTKVIHLNNKSKRPNKVRQLVAGVAIMVSLLAFAPDLHNGKVQNAGFITSDNNSRVYNNKVSSVVVNNIDTSDSDQVKLSESIGADASVPAKVYHIIVASYNNISQAKQGLAEIEKMSGKNSSVVLNNSKARVAIESFTDKDKAFSALDNYRNNSRFKSAWIFVDRQ